jgi:hypothetical protein
MCGLRKLPSVTMSPVQRSSAQPVPGENARVILTAHGSRNADELWSPFPFHVSISSPVKAIL